MPELILFLLSLQIAAAKDLPLEKIRLPTGFKIELYSDSVPGARSLALSPAGTVFVGTRGDKVYGLGPRQNGKVKTFTIASGLNSPNGVAVRNGALYVAEIHRVLRYDDIDKQLQSPPKPVVVKDGLPNKSHHGWKFIAFGPDDLLYLPIGALCNVCLPEPHFAAINRLKPDGTGYEVFAEGIRNTVGFDWHPVTKELWFTDNGRDMLGDDVPPDELNSTAKKGTHFGFPYCHGGDIHDPVYNQRKCAEFVPPVQKLGPHVASLGMRFYRGQMFPSEYKNQIFIAEHGSWNRSKKIGYRVTLVTLKGNKAVNYKPFAEGWLEDDSEWGRPVDILNMPDGAILVSDDDNGVVYRISYSHLIAPQ